MNYTMEKIIATNLARTIVKKAKESLQTDKDKLNLKNMIDDYAKLIHMNKFVDGVCILKEDFLEELDTIDINENVIYGFDFENNKIGNMLPMDKDVLMKMGDEVKFLVWYPGQRAEPKEIE